MKVLVATKESHVLATISQHNDAGAGIEPFVALDTGRIYKELPECQAAVVDEADLIANPFSPQLITKLIKAAGMPCFSSAAFIDDSGSLLAEKSLGKASLEFPDKKVIAFTSYSGGTGKTTLALGTAAHFCRVTRNALALPAAMFEFSYGASAIQALWGAEYPDIDQLVDPTAEATPGEFHGVTLFPLNRSWIAGQGEVPDAVRDYIRNQAGSHVLTVVDTKWPHTYCRTLHEQVDHWIVVAEPRVDAVDNARLLQQSLGQRYGEDKVLIAVNKIGGLTAQLALMGMQRDIELPQLKQEDLISSGKLGKVILEKIYGDLWLKYEKHGSRRKGLFGRLRRK